MLQGFFRTKIAANCLKQLPLHSFNLQSCSLGVRTFTAANTAIQPKPVIKPQNSLLAVCVAEKIDLNAYICHFDARETHKPTKETVRFVGNDAVHHRFAPTNEEQQEEEEFFVFASGSVVGWGCAQAAFDRHCGAIRSLCVDRRESEAHSAAKQHVEHVSWETLPAAAASILRLPAFTIALGARQAAEGVALDKAAFSHAVAHSVKLHALEQQLQHFLAPMSDLPAILAAGKRLPLHRAQILAKLGQLLVLRAQLNLHSGVGEVPDIFWNDSARESLFTQTADGLDVRKRSAMLNRKLDYANEIAALLKEHMSEMHSLKLEWCIILLIAVEVCFELVHFGEKLGFFSFPAS